MSFDVVVTIVAVVVAAGIKTVRVRRTGQAFWWSKDRRDR